MIREKIEAVLSHAMSLAPDRYNTDWFGNFLMSGLLEWNDLIPGREIELFAEKWLSYHLEADPELSDEEFYRQADAPRSRLLREYSLPLTTYAGYFGMSHACCRLYQISGDERARQICADIGHIILHQCARNQLGLVAHDDNEKPFTIPDVAYFVVPALFIAATMDEGAEASLRRQALLQIEGFSNTFFDRKANLTKTIYQDGTTGETFWIRAGGWLLWTVVESLAYIKSDAPIYKQLCSLLTQMAEGFLEYQDESGGFHLFVNEPDSPLETTGTIMIARGIHKAVRLGWIDRSYLELANRAWAYVDTKLDAGGKLTGCYSGWAVPAESRVLDFDRPMEWMQGMLLIAGAEFAHQMEKEA